MTKPVFILTQGAWHVSDVWQKLTPVLEAKGHKVRTLEWPSVIQEPAVKSYDEDIATIRKVVEEEVDAGNDVVVVGHSWSAQPINSGVAEFSKTERAKQGKRGGITKLAFLCAFVVPEGTALIDALGGEPDKVGIWDIQVRRIRLMDASNKH